MGFKIAYNYIMVTPKALVFLILNLYYGLTQLSYANSRNSICDTKIRIPFIGTPDQYPPGLYQTVINDLVRKNSSREQRRNCRTFKYVFDDRLELIKGQVKAKPGTCSEIVTIPDFGKQIKGGKFLRSIVRNYANDFQQKWCTQVPLKYRINPSLPKILDPKGMDWSNTEAQFQPCPGGCSSSANQESIRSRQDFQDISKMLQSNSKEPVSCVPQGYRSGMSSNQVLGLANVGALDAAVQRYSQRAQGAINRGYIALIKPQYINDVRSRTNNFTDFDRLGPAALERVLISHQESKGRCYKYVKAALSGDFRVLTRDRNPHNKSAMDFACQTDKLSGDLAEKHWRHPVDSTRGFSALAAGSAGPDLEKRGFINLMDPKYGLVQKYGSQEKAPPGAVLIYRCAINGRLLPEYSKAGDCYGHSKIKTRSGYLSDFYSSRPLSNAALQRRVLVGIYVKPEEG